MRRRCLHARPSSQHNDRLVERETHRLEAGVALRVDILERQLGHGLQPLRVCALEQHAENGGCVRRRGLGPLLAVARRVWAAGRDRSRAAESRLRGHEGGHLLPGYWRQNGSFPCSGRRWSRVRQGNVLRRSRSDGSTEQDPAAAKIRRSGRVGVPREERARGGGGVHGTQGRRAARPGVSQEPHNKSPLGLGGA